MLSALKVASFVFVVCGYSVFSSASVFLEFPSMCSDDEIMNSSCLCCKKTCWYGVVEMVTEYLRHMPGEKSDAETKFT